MATNRALRTALLAKLGVTPQALSQRVKRKKKTTPMSTENATYLIAHEEGVPIDKYLDESTLAEVRQLQSHTAGGLRSTPGRKHGRRQSPAATREVKLPSEFALTDPVMPESKMREAAAMARVYPLLYVLENSIREVIKRVMQQTSARTGGRASFRRESSGTLETAQITECRARRRGIRGTSGVGAIRLTTCRSTTLRPSFGPRRPSSSHA